MAEVAIVVIEALDEAEGGEYLLDAQGDGVDEALQEVRRLLLLRLVGERPEGEVHRVAAVGAHLGDLDGNVRKAVFGELRPDGAERLAQEAVVAGGVAVPVEIEDVHVLAV